MSFLDYLFQRTGGTRGRARSVLPHPAKGLDPGGGQDQDRRAPFGWLGWVFCIVLSAVTVVVLDWGAMPLPFKINDQAQRTIKAELDFSYADELWQERERKKARERTPLVFRQDAKWLERILEDYEVLTKVAGLYGSFAEVPQNVKAHLADKDEEILKELIATRGRGISLGVVREKLKDELIKLCQDQAVLHPKYERQRRERRGGGELQRIWVEKGKEATNILRQEPIEELRIRALDVALKNLEGNLRRHYVISDALALSLSSYFEERMGEILVLDEEEWVRSQDRAQQAVPLERTFRKGDDLILRDERFDVYNLRSLREHAQRLKESRSLGQILRHFLGLYVLTASVLAISVMMMKRIHPRIFQRRQPLIAHGLVCLGVLIFGKALALNQFSGQLTPIPIAAILASLAFSQPVASLTVSALAVLMGFTMGGDLTLMLSLMVGGMVSALPAGLLRNRWDLLKYGVLGGTAQAAVVLGLSTLGSALTYYPAPSDALAALGNCLGCAVVLLGAMPLLESAYSIITNIRLLELADHGHPALRKIQFEAPGTWAHTISVEFLAVPAAEAIGANARLVRAGVFYHDLGKTLKPEYFVENNPNAPERHRRLAPSVSALIITGHVKDGIQLAHEFRLPRQIVDFIPEHHGTTLVSYFYHSARKRAEEVHGEDAAENVQEAFFQYPGPKPQSRETAIVMLADTVEAASRTLENPSLPRIRAFVHELIMQKLLNGQLDESDLTFRDLARVEEEFNRVLMSRYHSRIKYPGQEGSQAGGAPRGRTDKSGLSLRDSDSRIQPLQRSPERGVVNGEETPAPTPLPTNVRAREQPQTPVPDGALSKAVPATREGGV